MARKNVTLHARLKWPEIKDHYVISQDDHSIGWIRLSGDRAGQAAPWEWSIVVPMALPGWTRGIGASRDECMREFSTAWGKILKETSPERLARAFDLQRSVD